MTRKQQISILLAVVVAVGLTAAFLTRLHGMQRLGTPGLKLVSQPIADETGALHGRESVFLPERVLEYTSESLPVTRTELEWLPPDTTYGRRLYRHTNGFAAQISIALMGSDRTSIHKPQYCLIGQGWRIDSTEKTTIRMQQPHPYDLQVMKLTTTRLDPTRPGAADSWRGVYLYWFVADGQLTADHGQRMWWMARDLVSKGVLERWAYVTCFAVCRPGEETATFDRMEAFLSAAVPQFQLVHGPQVVAGTSSGQ